MLPSFTFTNRGFLFFRISFLCLCPRCAFRYPPTSLAALRVNFVNSFPAALVLFSLATILSTLRLASSRPPHCSSQLQRLHRRDFLCSISTLRALTRTPQKFQIHFPCLPYPSALVMFQFVSTNDFLACMALHCLFLSASLHGPCLFSSPCLGRFCGHAAVSLPDTHTHPPLAVHCPRLCCCSHIFPLLYGFCQSVSFALPVLSCLPLCFLVFAPCYFLSVLHCSFFFLPGPPSYMCLPVVLPSIAILVR